MQADKEIWILEDDSSLHDLYAQALGFRWRLKFFKSLAEYKSAPENSPPDILIADLSLRDGNFLTAMTQAKKKSLEEGAFMVVSSTDDLDAIRACYALGALDYLVKPFKKNELIAKVERLLKNSLLKHSVHSTHSSAVVMNAANQTLWMSKELSVQLTSKEFQILITLFKSKDQTASRIELLNKVWPNTNVSDNTLDVHLFRLRQKVSSFGIKIAFHPEKGFVLSGADIEIQL